MILRDDPEIRKLSSEKIGPAHLQRLAVVYVRQSTPQQVLDHRESTRLQYGLVTRAQEMGWPKDRVLLIDDDLGKSGASSEGRAGFRRLVSEVSLDHVGIILGVEMSRLARSSKDWHQLLEICALFATLIADLDGVYDPAHYNDRLLLGLKGTMSEAELHVIKQRMDRGKLSKARRGELVLGVPIGYVKSPSSGEVVLDPDEQVRHVVGLVFRKFEELETLNAVLRYLVEHNVQIGVRVREGIGKGELQWHRPNRATLHNMLKNPTYAGAYAYGRRRLDPRKRQPGRRGTGRVALSPQEWPVLLKDRFPAYIPWEQYERNLAKLESNRSRSEAMRAVRNGAALLTGVVVCGKCGWRMSVWYGEGRYTYACRQKASHYGGRVCQHIAGPVLDEYVSGWVLEALEPAALELSLEAANNLQRERDDLNQLWQERLERSTYEADRAERQYHLVEPENRLVARRLEREWEEKLQAQQRLREEYDRFVHSQPRTLSEEEIHAIRRLSADIPALWEAPSTTAADRKQIIRQVVERVVVDADGASERVRARIEWAGGGAVTEGELIRPVARFEQLSYWPQLCDRVRVLAQEGFTAAQIAEDLNAEGYKPPKRSEVFRAQGVRKLMRRLGLSRRQEVGRPSDELGEQEWWLADLAKALRMSRNTLYNWVRCGWVRCRQGEGGRWIVWADEAEIERLGELHRRPTGYYTRQKWIRGYQT